MNKKKGFITLKTCFALGNDITAVKDFVEDEVINFFSSTLFYSSFNSSVFDSSSVELDV